MVAFHQKVVKKKKKYDLIEKLKSCSCLNDLNDLEKQLREKFNEVPRKSTDSLIQLPSTLTPRKTLNNSIVESNVKYESNSEEDLVKQDQFDTNLNAEQNQIKLDLSNLVQNFMKESLINYNPIEPNNKIELSFILNANVQYKNSKFELIHSEISILDNTVPVNNLISEDEIANNSLNALSTSIDYYTFENHELKSEQGKFN